MLSREVSGKISHFIADFLGGAGGSSDQDHYFLRKAAHFCEFASLGAVFLLFIRECTEQIAIWVSLSALIGVLAPLIDETIQMFSNRGSALTDVWLDIFGYVAGSLFCLFIVFLMKRYKKDEK